MYHDNAPSYICAVQGDRHLTQNGIATIFQPFEISKYPDQTIFYYQKWNPPSKKTFMEP